MTIACEMRGHIFSGFFVFANVVSFGKHVFTYGFSLYCLYGFRDNGVTRTAAACCPWCCRECAEY